MTIEMTTIFKMLFENIFKIIVKIIKIEFDDVVRIVAKIVIINKTIIKIMTNFLKIRLIQFY